MVKQCRFGILGTGSIAKTFAKDLKHSEHAVLQAVASRTLASASSFSEEFGGQAVEGYDQLIARNDIDAVYIATPHTEHIKWVDISLRANKPVLCEKPLGINHGQVLSMYGQASRSQTLLVEAMMHLIHPRIMEAKGLIDAGEIGEIISMSASFGFEFPYSQDNKTHRLYDRDLAGGAILDIGIYPMTALLYLLGAPSNINVSESSLTPEGIDSSSSLKLEVGGISVHLQCSTEKKLPLEITIKGSKAELVVVEAWHPGPDNQDILVSDLEGCTVYQTEETKPLYAMEADHMAELIDQGKLESDLVTPQFSIDTAFWLDRWREKAQVSYAADQLSSLGLLGQEVAVNKPSNDGLAQMPRQYYAPLGKDVSRLVLGTDNQLNPTSMAAIADAFVQAGGNTFDTAHIYSDGLGEKLLGQWISARNFNREELIIIGKGAHTPQCNPEAISQQLDISLERLGTRYIDIYFLHRDNPDIPADEWADALNREFEAGRIRQFGGSNWSSDRVDAVNQAAAEKSWQPMNVLSNNFSLAKMVEPVWPGCVASSSSSMMDWHQEKQIPLFAWSSQARGFFLDWETQGMAAQKHAADPSLDEINRVWVSEQNLQRKRRAGELAKKYQVKTIQIALAYLFQQSFPIFALIGARTIAQLDESVAATMIQLTDDEMAYLSA